LGLSCSCARSFAGRFAAASACFALSGFVVLSVFFVASFFVMCFLRSLSSSFYHDLLLNVLVLQAVSLAASHREALKAIISLYNFHPAK